METVSKEKRELAKEIALCRREMVGMIWKDKEERRNGRTESDTIGMDFFFIAGLLSQEGKRDFLAHCRMMNVFYNGCEYVGRGGCLISLSEAGEERFGAGRGRGRL